MKLLFILLRSLIYVPLFIGFFGWLALRVRVYDHKMNIALPPGATVAGVIFMIAGAILVLTCIAIFISRGKGTPAVFDPPTVFVATGPYAYVRNPMYIGGFVLLTGFGLFHRSPSILVLAGILIILFHLFVVFLEEPALKKLFGNSYAAYKKQVNRWLPKRKRIFTGETTAGV
jgi:protein-S-isoprenylcysteine O-methyltransferase Ste14